MNKILISVNPNNYHIFTEKSFIKAILLPIHGKYCRLIFDTMEKTHEFKRKIWKNREVKYVFVYETAPCQRIIGYFKIGDIIEDSISHLLEIAYNSDNPGLTEKEFIDYYEGLSTGYAIQILNPTKLDSPIKLSIKPPQFCKYISCYRQKNGKLYPMGVSA